MAPSHVSWLQVFALLTSILPSLCLRPSYESHIDLADVSQVSIRNFSTMKLSVVMISDKPNDNRTKVLTKSLEDGDFNTVHKRFTPNGEFSWARRLEIIQDIVDQAAQADPEQVFLFIDAFDIFTLGSEQEVIEKFQRTSKDALFSCVTYPYPHQCEGFNFATDGACKESLWGAQCKNWCRFACAGAFMGKAGMFSKIFAETPLAGVQDDQCYFNKVFAKKNYNIALDSQQDIFFSSTDLLQCSLERKNGRLKVTNTGTYPSVIHFDATHPTAKHLEEFRQNALNMTDGLLCPSNNSCTDWCWNYDIGDMPMRLSPYQIIHMLGFLLPNRDSIGRHVWLALALGCGLGASIVLSVVACFSYRNRNVKQGSHCGLISGEQTFRPYVSKRSGQ